MSSTGIDSDPAQPGQAPPTSQGDIEQLSEEILLQRAILNSLNELPSDPYTRLQIEEATAQLRRLKNRLSAARQAQSQQSARPKFPPAANTSANMKGPNANVPQSSRGEKQFGPSSFSGASTPSGMSTPSTSSSVWTMPSQGGGGPSRKRSFASSHLDATISGQRENKSRRASPGPAGTAITSSAPPSEMDFDDDCSVIDLTGDDDESTQLLRQEEERLARNKKNADMDAEMARQLQEDGIWPAPSSSSYSSSYPRLPAVKLENPRHGATSTPGPSTGASSSSSVPYGARYPGIKPEPAGPSNPFRVPGAYNDDDDDDEYGSFTMPARPKPLSAVSGYTPGSLNYAPGVPAIELARQAAITRQEGGTPSSSASGSGDQISRHFSHGPWSGPSSNNFASTSYGAHRPGYLTDGRSNAFQGFNPGDMLGAAGMLYQPGGRPLSEIIRESNRYDFNSMTDGQGNPLDSRLADYIADFVDDPRKTNEEIKELLSNIRPDMDIPEEERGQTPEALKYPLYTHQQLALKWMTDMEEKPTKGGILADDMGLGKTISTIALMVTRQSPPNKVKTNLIIGPVALIKQWEGEIEKKVKRGHRLRVCLLHGKKIAYSELRNYDVVLTTYGTLAQEWKRYDRHVMARQDGEGYEAKDDFELQRLCPIIHPRSQFYRVILDESQCIKNKDAQSSKGASLISATYRWCLTGTPMMNGVSELFPLIRFLKIRPYCEFKQFQKAFSSLTAKNGRVSDYSRDGAMRQLRIVLKAIMLRRMKNSEIDGKPILQLPPKTETSDHVVFSDDEQRYYQDLESKSRVVFSKYLRQGTIGKNYSNILVLLLRLRQACCHPHLNMDVEYANIAEVSVDTMMELAKSLAPGVVERIKAVEAFECPICYDAVEDPTLVIPCGHDTCSECFASLTDNSVQNNIRSGQESTNGKCPQCRGPIVSTKVINYSTFRKVHMPETVKEPSPAPAKVEDDSDDSTDSDSEFASDTEDDDDDDDDEEDDAVDDDGNLRDFIVPDDDIEDDDGDEDDSGNNTGGRDRDGGGDGDDDDEFPDLAAMPPKQESKKAAKRARQAKIKKGKKKAKGKGKGKAKLEKVEPHMLKALRFEASKNKEARRRYMHYLKKNWQPSAKVTKITELLTEIQPTGEKTIVFSQWTALLDLLEIPIKYDLGMGYCRYDGGMSRRQRDVAVHDFVENPDTTVMLVSLRAGNAGLNLTAASHVIVCDPFWNPYIELQAVDRAHRIGQQRPVTVHRVLVEGTVEDRIIELQERKRALVDSALDEGESRNLGRLNVRELGHLFGVPTD